MGTYYRMVYSYIARRYFAVLLARKHRRRRMEENRKLMNVARLAISK